MYLHGPIAVEEAEIIGRFPEASRNDVGDQHVHWPIVTRFHEHAQGTKITCLISLQHDFKL